VSALFAAIGSFAALPLGQAVLAAWTLGLAAVFTRERVTDKHLQTPP